jgi:hypothetical protein
MEATINQINTGCWFAIVDGGKWSISTPLVGTQDEAKSDANAVMKAIVLERFFCDAQVLHG